MFQNFETVEKATAHLLTKYFLPLFFQNYHKIFYLPPTAVFHFGSEVVDKFIILVFEFRSRLKIHSVVEIT
jgi:hypothetical protein